MRYTDTLFSFPVRIYDGFSVRKNMQKEEMILDELDSPLEDDWVEGTAEIPPYEICGLIDNFSEGRKTADVSREGFDRTIVMTKTLGDFASTLNRREFKKRLNEFVDKYDKMIDHIAEEMIEKKGFMFSTPPKKTSWWKKLFA